MNKGIYYASFTALLWGFLAIALKVSLNDLSPVTITWIRFTISFVILFAYYLFTDRQVLTIIAKPPLYAIIAAFALSGNYYGFITGIHLTTPLVGQIFIQAGPALLALSGFVVFKERINVKQGIGLFVVVIGLFIFYREQIVKVAGSMSDYRNGVALVLFAAFSWATYGVFQKLAVRKFSPMPLNLIIFGIPTLLFAPFVEYGKFSSLTFNNWLLLLFLGLNTLGAYGSLAYAFKYLQANKISVIITLNPLITLVAMAWLSHKQVSWIAPETFTVLTVAGALTVLTGVILTVSKQKS